MGLFNSRVAVGSELNQSISNHEDGNELGRLYSSLIAFSVNSMIELAAALAETLLLGELLRSNEMHHSSASGIASCSVITEQILEPYSASRWVVGASGCFTERRQHC